MSFSDSLNHEPCSVFGNTLNYSCSFPQVIHRDLACRNVLVDSKLSCKICDFGLARKLDKTGVHRRSEEVSGSLVS